jgi:hypothetical protein
VKGELQNPTETCGRAYILWEQIKEDSQDNAFYWRAGGNGNIVIPKFGNGQAFVWEAWLILVRESSKQHELSSGKGRKGWSATIALPQPPRGNT